MKCTILKTKHQGEQTAQYREKETHQTLQEL